MTIKFELNATGAVLVAAVVGMVVALGGVGVYSLVRPTSAPPVTAPVSKSALPPAANSMSPVTSAEQEPAEPHGGRRQVLDRLTDPSAAQFRNTFYGPVVDGERAWCGEVNAKNQLGGYVGFERFIATRRSAFIDTRDSEQASVFWPALCEQEKLKSVTADSAADKMSNTHTPVFPAAETGKKVYQQVCAACHATGVAGAPKFGDKTDWAPRLSAGTEALHTVALRGKGVMPPKGGYAGPDADVIAASDYMVSAVK
ncbi:Cytochrome c5 [Cupriavidus necator H850]|uniref:c-type cytochrome n=1 Tax=Cupriavidus necator TaxID=106590 RepID=UPI00129D9A53|nr:c-type cytochrome [Cupriavidus necator]KAI3606298.1 Cytochrome c5 [Cupriavidus necator H850]